MKLPELVADERDRSRPSVSGEDLLGGASLARTRLAADEDDDGPPSRRSIVEDEGRDCGAENALEVSLRELVVALVDHLARNSCNSLLKRSVAAEISAKSRVGTARAAMRISIIRCMPTR